MKYLNLIQDHDNISSVKPEGVNVIRCLDDDHVHYNKINNNDHEYVDLGLPSGALGATINIGATSIEDNGDGFSGGETEPKYVSRNPIVGKEGMEDGYRESTYKFGSATMTKYNKTDLLTILEPEDDAAHVIGGGDGRIPTLDQFQEMKNNCDLSSVTINNKTCTKYTSKINGNYIIIPFTYRGYRLTTYSNSEPCVGFANLSPKRSDSALCNMYSVLTEETVMSRYVGMPIRPILSPTY